MARTSAPNSATSEFFFNTADNPSLDHGGQGANSNGYAVFGVVRGSGMSVVDASAAVPPVNEGGTFASLPITGATPNDPNFPTDTTASQYERITGVSVLRQPNAAAPDSLTFTATSSNTSLVTTAISNGELTLTYANGQTGSSTITLTATDSAGVSVTSTFTVAVGDNAAAGGDDHFADERRVGQRQPDDHRDRHRRHRRDQADRLGGRRGGPDSGRG